MPRIALAQIDVRVGDVDGNARLATDAIRDAAARGAALVLTPELTLTGCPPEDLLAKEHFVDDQLAALEAVAVECRGVTAVVGFVDRGPEGLHNAVAICQAGRVAAVYRKRRLPNYGIFDEERYFEPGDGPLVLDLAGVAWAPTICEDVWDPGPAAESASAGARLLVNASASPFHAGRGAERESMLASRARDNGVWLAYCNLVGGQDELVFDGRSVVLDPSGRVVARARAFEPDLLLADVADEDPEESRTEAPLEGEEEVYSALILGLRDYVEKNGFAEVVVGLSGGIDSALAATLATDALGPARVHGVTMPSRYSSPASVTDAMELCGNLGIDCREVEIEAPFAALLDTLSPSFAGLAPDVTEENLQARVRGALLMALSNKHGWLVLATGNKSELSVGYSTLYGDMVGGFAPLKDVYKTRVYALAHWRNARGEVIPASSISKPPSAELRPGQLDTDSLPPYDLLDRVLEAYVEGDRSIDAIVAGGFDRDLVERVTAMVDRAEYKRRQGPLGIRITPKAFGKDRRMPVTNAYRG